MYIAVVLSYGEALADRIVSYRDILSDIVSYLCFLLWLYRAITIDEDAYNNPTPHTIPKGVQTLRTQDSSDPRQFGIGAEVSVVPNDHYPIEKHILQNV